MKSFFYFLAALLLTATPALGATTSSDHVDHVNRFYRGYGSSFIFVEQGIEFAVFPDGQFDFNVLNYGPNFSAFADFGGVSISFNSGYGYDAYVQYDDFGAVVQIENVPIYYDYYGRITQAGSVRITYNNFGRVLRVGGLFVHYNRFNRFSHCTGFINVYNRHYVLRPWHNYYVIPAYDYCVVYNRPYRRYYNPVRYTYYNPYRNNIRPRTSVSYTRGRRGDVARVTNNRSDRYRSDRVSRRGDLTDNSARIDRQRPGRDEQSLSRDGRINPRRGDKADRQDMRTRPSVNSRNDKTERIRPESANRTRPSVNDRSGKTKRVRPESTARTRPATGRDLAVKNKAEAKRTGKERKDFKSKRLSSENNRKTNALSSRSKYSNPKVSAKRPERRISSVSNRKSVEKARPSGTASKKRNSATRKSRQ